MMASFQAAMRLFIPHVSEHYTSLGLDHHLCCCIQSSHSGCQVHTHPPGNKEDGAPQVVGVLSWPVLGVGSQQHPFVHKGHSYVTCFKQGSLCICLCVLSTICDQFNGNFIYLKKKHK